MTRTSRGLTLLLLPALLWRPAEGQGVEAWKRCNMDSLATWNCAMYYSGTVSQVSILKVNGKEERSTVNATITAGQVACRVTTTGQPDYDAPGMLVVGHATAGNRGGEYDFQVWCGESAGKRAKRGDYPVIELADLQATDYAKLDGKTTYEHPDADEANGVAGSVTVTWHFVRQ